MRSKTERYNDHISALVDTARLTPDRPAFKYTGIDSNNEWRTVSFAEFLTLIGKTARYLHDTLAARDILPRSVVTLWVSGYQFLDALYLMALSRAGYTVQLCSLAIDNIGLLASLMSTCKSRAVFCDGAQKDMITLSNTPFSFPTYNMLEGYQIAQASTVTLEDTSLPAWNPAGKDVAFILHSSGSVSGSPKPLPLTFDFTRHVVRKLLLWFEEVHSADSENQKVFFFSGSAAHAAGLYMLLMRVCWHGQCQVLPGGPVITGPLLCQLVEVLGLNSLTLFGPSLGNILTVACHDEKLRQVLTELGHILYAGAEVPSHLAEWAEKQGISLLSALACTEAGVLMGGKPGHPYNVLFPLIDSEYRIAFSPTGLNASGSQNALMEIVVPIESPDCPSHHFDMFTGNYYTADICEVLPGGGYIWRGRDDDFIKTSATKGVDGKSIQDEVYRTCSDLVSACVVVGHGRPSAALLVEPSSAYSDSAQWDSLKAEIIRRLGPSMDKRYSHERITDRKLVAVLRPGSLPRTVAKGNIKRRFAEEQYRTLLDEMHSL